MIVPMKKVFVAAREADHDRLVDLLGKLGVVHLVPVDADRAVADDDTLAAIDRADRAVQVLSAFEPSKAGDTTDAADAVEKVLRLEQQSIDGRARLHTLHQQIRELDVWGDVELEQLDALDETVGLQFALVPTDAIGGIEADLVCPIGQPKRKEQLLAIASRDGEVTLPEEATPIERPQRDRPTLKAEAATIDAMLATNSEQLAAMAYLTDSIQSYRDGLTTWAEATVASRSATSGHGVTALQGWVPAKKASTLHDDLTAEGLDAAIDAVDPTEDDAPPTLTVYPRWARPIQGLFNVLGTVAGYDEFDVGVPFILAFPIFAAMLIGDGGYGALMVLAFGLFYGKLAPKLGRPLTQLMIIVGAATLIWGTLSGNFFGVRVFANPLIPVDMTDQSRSLIMNISFYMGAIHLSVAQLWQAVRVFPSLQFLSKIGWAAFIWGMLGLVQQLVLGYAPVTDPSSPFLYLLLSGAMLAILFAHPSRNPLKMLGLGIADFPLNMISAFSDVISYVRLMAVGLASGILATSFNELAMDIDFLPATIVILILAHALNLALCIVAMFAHGVRLNMLEFCNNLGMQWTGYAYQPFACVRRQETVQ